jgi:hypothetical protein
VSGRLTGFRRRLAKVEQALAETAEQEKQVSCICIPNGARLITIACSLGEIMVLTVVGPGQKKDERCRLDDLLADYRAREAEYSRNKLEHEHREV